MSMLVSLCSLAVLAAAITVIVYAFIGIFQEKQPGENDLNVIQRQIRSFALLIVSNLIMVVGMAFCSGQLFPGLIPNLERLLM
jgi:hypothetical protein